MAQVITIATRGNCAVEGAQRKEGVSARAIFIMAIAAGLLLRAVAAIWGDIDPGGDGLGRMAESVRWAHNPRWMGLTGVWPYLHFYFLGALIKLWNDPIILAKLINFGCGVASIFALRSAVRPMFGDMAASLSALLLAIFWTHIWLTSSYWVEIPYLLLILLAVARAMKARESLKSREALMSGLFLSLAILLRHEAMMLLAVFLVWYAINVKSRRIVLMFAAMPLCAAAWNFIEPLMSGHSYFEYAAEVAQMKAGENLTQGVTLIDCLKQWVLIPAVAPSVIVVVPGLVWLFKSKRLRARDLFAWMLIAQIGFALFMTLAYTWRPQLRYVMLYFVNLLPYAAIGWMELMKKYSSRLALVSLLSLTIAVQAAGWWFGRNNLLPMGWLPLRVVTSSQKAVDDWMAEKISKNYLPSFIVAIVGSESFTDPWSLEHSIMVNRITPGAVESMELNIAYEPGIARGDLPQAMYEADQVLIDPATEFYQKVVAALRKQKTGVQAVHIHPHIAVISSQQATESLNEN